MKRIVFFGLIMFSANAFGQTLSDAMKLTENERYEKATSVFKALITKEATNAEAYFYFGENYFYSDNTDSALALYKKGMELNPRFPLNHIGYGKMLWIDGKESEAKSTFEKTVAMFAERGNRTSAELKARTYLEIAEALIFNEKKDADAALINIDKAIELDPKNPDLYLLKGDILFEKDSRDASEPMKMYKKAIEFDVKAAAPVAKKAYLYYRAYNYVSAIDEFTNAIKLDPSYAPAYRQRAEAYYQNKKLDLAIADYKKYLDLNNGNVSARVRYAAFLFLAEKYKESIEEMDDIEKSNTNLILIKRIRGYCEYELGNYDKAKATLDMYFQKQNEKKLIISDFSYMGKTLIKLGNDSLAINYYNRLLKKDPSKRAIVSEVGVSFYKEKKFKATIKIFEGIIKNCTPEANDYFWIGRAAERVDLLSKADTAYTGYIKFYPEIYEGYYYRGKVRSQMDDQKNMKWLAKDDYLKAIELGEKLEGDKLTKAYSNLQWCYFYVAYYYFVSSEKDLGLTKCYYTKLITRCPDLEQAKEVVKQKLLERADLKSATIPEGCK